MQLVSASLVVELVVLLDLARSSRRRLDTGGVVPIGDSITPPEKPPIGKRSRNTRIEPPASARATRISSQRPNLRPSRLKEGYRHSDGWVWDGARGQIRSKLNPESNGDKTGRENDKCGLSC